MAKFIVQVILRMVISDGEIYTSRVCTDCWKFLNTLVLDYFDDDVWYEDDLAIAKQEEGWVVSDE